MRFQLGLTLTLGALLISSNALAFGGKKFDYAELKGTSETQVASATEGKGLSVMIRGKAAEMVYLMIQDKRQLDSKSAAAEALGSKATQWTVKGNNLTCSRVTTADKQNDYACSFDMQTGGKLVAGEAFRPQVFNLALTKTDSKIWAKEDAGRAIASATAPQVSFDGAKAYVMYSNDEERQKPEQAMVVIHGRPAADIRDFLAKGGDGEAFDINGVEGRKNGQVSCVAATKSESERCALVIDLAEGNITSEHNPLF